MPEHNHITRGDVIGCPSCDIREGRAPVYAMPSPEPDYPTVPDFVKAMPDATHRLVDQAFVCEGGEAHKCHWYPDDCECGYWPCGHDYTFHERCWQADWFDAMDLLDTDIDEGEHRDPETLRYPDGEIETEWEGECVLWSYVPAGSADPSPARAETLPDQAGSTGIQNQQDGGQ